MIRVPEIMQFIEELAPAATALGWDNVGLQVGDPDQSVSGVLLALDMSLPILEEAVETGANLIITHHPLVFKPLRTIDFSLPVGKMIRSLITHKISLISAHTNLDRSPEGTGRALAEKIGLQHIERYTEDPKDEMNMVVTGRFEPARTEDEVIAALKAELKLDAIRTVGSINTVTTVAIIPGSGGSLVRQMKRPYDLIITGEVSYHDALEARYAGQAVIALGHYVSEKPAMYRLAELLRKKFPNLSVQVADREGEPYDTL